MLVTPGLIFISGSSGAGKSSALHLLEDEGYYCVDNLPPRLLPQFSKEVAKRTEYERFRGVAVCIDARTIGVNEAEHSETLEKILSSRDKLIVFLDAQPHTLLKRFSETRRRHPLAGSNNSLPEAIARERKQLEFIAARADLLIDTSDLTPRALRDRIISRIIVRYLAMFLRDIVHLNIRGPVTAGTRHGAPKNETTCADAPEKYELAPCAPQEVDDDHSAVAHPDAEATGAESPARLS